MWVTTFFTVGGSPETGLTPILDIYRVSDDTAIASSVAMSEIGVGWYKYNFTDYVEGVEYVITCDGGATLGIFERYTYGGNEVFAGEISNFVWDEDLRDHTERHSAGKMVQQIRRTVNSILALIS